VKFLLDTSICVFALRGHAGTVERLSLVAGADLAVSVMTAAELWVGVRKSREPEVRRVGVAAFLAPFSVLPFDVPAAERYVEARCALEAAGRPIGERDLIIAATALAHGLTVVTNNTREFGRVPGLAVDDWSAASR
jgi:tRNA(fMet)-specific endonuclease VapC